MRRRMDRTMENHVKHCSVELPAGEAWEAFQQFTEVLADVTNSYILTLSEELGLNEEQAASIYYLRTRSRHTPELQQRCIAAMRAGHTLSIGSGEELEELERLGF